MKSETVLARKLAVGGIVSLLLLAGCGGGTSPSSSGSNLNTSGASSVPTIQDLFPNCAPAGEPVQLQVVGTNFVAGSVVRWNGTNQPTTLNATNGLVAQISASEVASAGTAAVTVFNPGTGGGSSKASTFTINSGAPDPRSIAVDTAGKFAYVASFGCDFDGYVSMYTINPTTGALASIGPPVPSNDEFTDFVTVDPSGKFAYVASSGDVWDIDFGSVSAYSINSTTGALTSTTGGITGTGINGTPELFNSVAFDPSGKFAYAADGGAFPAGSFGSESSVSMYTVNSTTGALTLIGMIDAGACPDSVAVDPAGNFAYVTNFCSNDVSMYSIDATTGALTSIGSIAAGTNAFSVAVDPTGKFAYVVNTTVNNTDGSVSMYSIDATTGVLTPTGTIATGLSPTSIAIHPSGKFAYVTNSASSSVSMYSIDSATGTLTLIGTIGT